MSEPHLDSQAMTVFTTLDDFQRKYFSPLSKVDALLPANPQRLGERLARETMAVLLTRRAASAGSASRSITIA